MGHPPPSIGIAGTGRARQLIIAPTLSLRPAPRIMPEPHRFSCRPLNCRCLYIVCRRYARWTTISITTVVDHVHHVFALKRFILEAVEPSIHDPSKHCTQPTTLSIALSWPLTLHQMCYYTTATRTYIRCERGDKHRIENTLWEYCNDSDWITPCENAAPNPNLIFGSSKIPGPCDMCAEIAKSASCLHL